MNGLSGLPNVGQVMEKRLAAVGVTDVETLRRLGSREVFIRLRLHEGDTCLCTLCGLEGAVQGIRWHSLPKETKAELKTFFDAFKRV